MDIKQRIKDQVTGAPFNVLHLCGEEIYFADFQDYPAAAVNGSLIAVDRKIALSPGRINGQVCGDRDQSYVSGSSVRCPTP